MGGGMALAGVLIYYKPDTSYGFLSSLLGDHEADAYLGTGLADRIEGWARKEALAKNAAAGEVVSIIF